MEAAEMILAAIVAGASAGAEKVAATAVKDAYLAVIKLVSDKYKSARAALAEVRAKPDSKEAHARLLKELEAATKDEALIVAATALAREIQKHAPAKPSTQGAIDVSGIIAKGDVLLARLRAASVSVANVTTDGGFTLTDVETNPK